MPWNSGTWNSQGTWNPDLQTVARPQSNTSLAGGHRILAFPFRLGRDGSVVTVEQETIEAHAQQVAAYLLTVVGERPLVPGFGISDPTFELDGLEEAEVRAAVAQFGPPIDVVGVRPQISIRDVQSMRVTVAMSEDQT